MKARVEIVPYGEISSALTRDRWRRIGQRARLSTLQKAAEVDRRIVVTFSHDVDQSFVDLFRRKATQDTQLLILNEGASADTLLSRIIDLRIRKPERCYVMEAKCEAGKTHVMLHSILVRLASGFEPEDERGRIFDARLENRILHVVSPQFHRLDVPIASVPDLKDAAVSKVERFVIDEDGSFIYWPELDVHLGWSQLQQIANPAAALKALQKQRNFNKRYGKAVQNVRERAGLRRSSVAGLSGKQVGRIEKAECRLTANAIQALAKAHQLAPNDYMTELAEELARS